MPTRMFSLRVDAATLDKLDDLGRETGESRSRLAQRLIEEGLRMEAHPGIEFRDAPTGRRASTKGGADVWELANVVKAIRERGEDVIEESTRCTGHTPAQIRAAIGYYAAYPEEIEDRIRRNDEVAEAAYAAWLREQALVGR